MITDHLLDPEALEKLYRKNKRDFTREFQAIAGPGDSELVRFWKIRLDYETGTAMRFSLSGLVAVIIICMLTALLVKIPVFFSTVDETAFYMRNLAVIAFSGLILYTLRKRKSSAMWMAISGAVVVALLFYVNLLPYRESDSLILALIHVPLFLWCLFGAAFLSFDLRDAGKRMEFIRHNGELLTMTGLLLITGGILTVITFGLFSAIGVDIEKTYVDYIVIPGSAVSPILASYIIGLYPDITRRIAPVIARVFTPIALLTLVIYLVSLAFSGIRILENRDLLIVFNVMLIAVMAIIVFSITELDKGKNRVINVLILLILAAVCLLINAVALTAIITRLTYGLTPNRMVVFVTNVLVFIHLLLIAKDLFRAYFNDGRLDAVERTVAKYLTVYFLWTLVAIFILPAAFSFQ